MLWVALAVVALGSAISAWLVILSLRPERGANMVLMGLPCVAAPVAVAALVAVGVAATGEAGLKKWERYAAWGAGGLALMVFGALAILG
ncbi:hypothetical protein FRUB_07480 [Fimbriiglobus ruber]|uniref:Transmembrane protein n=2 Tax=Fimbriiglobus ruber TaxID=1908690 RepID=A0A225D9S3_9BACT|nr:hypothetical protein FRUB_07480 [Fimbriiglobus ruber]